ncbi:MAG: Penicillin-binding protein 2D [Elusimicrobia bacterium]|nr:Penicillin-binding protein 2D [Elusimicrobiota bacterium]
MALLLFVVGWAVLSLAFLHKSIKDLPSVEALGDYVPPLVTQIVDTYGQPVGEFFTERRTTVPLTQIPVDLRTAVMAIEDTQFYQHWGINLRAILRASAANLLAGKVVQGGSTLTQQLAKTIFLTRQKTLGRKFKEMLLTLQIEHRYSKDEILQLYLNQIYFGGGAYGVEAAARLYFDKHTPELNLAECALLAGLIRSPNRYSPANNIQIAQDRRATVLRRMRELQFISESEEKQANATPIIETMASSRMREAPYLLEEVRKTLEPVYGTETLEQGGLTIQTTLDVKLQKIAETVLEKHCSTYDAKYATATLVEYVRDLKKGSTEQITISTTPPHIQAALVAIDVHTGAIRALIGGRNFQQSQFNRAMQAKRQPGSSFKPFVYAAALEGNYTAASVVDDYPMVFVDVESDPTLLVEATTYAQTQIAVLDNLQMTQEELDALDKEERETLLKRYWRPQNFDGKYLGPLTLRKALQKSRNLVSIRLVDSVGPRLVVRLARAAGINSYLAPVLSLGLGTSVVNLLELTSAYGSFATGGLHAEPYFVEKVSDRRGRVLQEAAPKITSRLNPQTVFLTVNIMKGVVERGTGWYAKRLGRPLAGKTGTTQDQRDLLFVGFSPDLVCGVWIGYDDFRPLKKGLSASNIAVPLWTDFMREALKSMPVRDFPIPPKIEFCKIDSETGYLALPSCPKVILEAFKEGTIPAEFCPYDHTKDQGSEVEEVLE